MPLQVKGRSKRLSTLFHSYSPYSHLVGTSCHVLVTDISSDGRFFVGHDKTYCQVNDVTITSSPMMSSVLFQVLVPREDGLMGEKVKVRIISAGKHYVMG